jgi:hypothetical protein
VFSVGEEQFLYIIQMNRSKKGFKLVLSNLAANINIIK